jgi:branched-chain amino acid transport system substrate-binding protein
MNRKALIAGAMLALSAHSVEAAEGVKIGFISTLSGPASALGVDIRDGFSLAVKHSGGRLGGLPIELIVADDQLKPDVAVQLATRMIEREKVDFLTGIVFSNLLLAVAPVAIRNETFYLSANAGPSELADARCSPFYFNVSWQNDNTHEAMGQFLQSQGVQDVYLLAPNYPAGRDALAGFKRFYKGSLKSEIYTQLGQLDYAAELAQLAAAKPKAVFFFLPGGMGVNFIKQYAQAGLQGQIPLYGPSFSFSQDVLDAVGEAALGVFNSSHWSRDIDNPANRKFVQAFEAEYGRMPDIYASQGYDTALLLDSAIKAVGGKIEDKDAVRAALRAAKFDSVRGNFKFNRNHHPIQDFYVRQVVKDEKGRLTNLTRSKVFTGHSDSFAESCKMTW